MEGRSGNPLERESFSFFGGGGEKADKVHMYENEKFVNSDN